MNSWQTESHIFKLKSGEFNSSFMTPKNSSGKLALVLPGVGYSCKQPLLFFLSQLLLKERYNVLTIDTVYKQKPEWVRIASKTEALKIVEEDTLDLFEKIKIKYKAEPEIVAGFSLGAYSMACAVEHKIMPAKKLIWIGPSLNDKWSTLKKCDIPSLVIFGTEDERYSDARPYLPANSYVVEGADHSLETPDDPLRSIEILKQVNLKAYEWFKS